MPFEEKHEKLIKEENDMISKDEKNKIIAILKWMKATVKAAEQGQPVQQAKHGAKLVRFLSDDEVKAFKEGGKSENQDLLSTEAGVLDISNATKGLSQESAEYLRKALNKDVSVAADLKKKGDKSIVSIETAATNSAYRHRLEALGADLISTIASFFPGVGTAIGAGAGITATILNAIADNESGASGLEILKTVGVGLASSAVTAVAPALGAAKIGPKVAAFIKLAGPLWGAWEGGSQLKDKLSQW